jgi:hypothetical protein
LCFEGLIALKEHDPGLRAVGHKYDSWSFPYFETMIVSVAGAPCQKTVSSVSPSPTRRGSFETDAALRGDVGDAR